MRRNLNALWGALLLVLCAAVLVSQFTLGFLPVHVDELSTAWSAKQAAMGLVPYGDYFSFYPPVTIYGIAAVFHVFGASLGILRLFIIPWLVGSTLLLYFLVLRAGLKAPWAAGLAFTFPALFIPYWPVTSHHWIAIGFGLLALYVAGHTHLFQPSSRWFLAGVLAGLSGLSLQTDGLLICLLLGGLLWLESPGEKPWRCAAFTLMGMALPVAVFALLLSVQGALGWCIYDLIIWPSRYYKQAGGFNQKGVLSSLSEVVAREDWSFFSLFRLALALIGATGALALAAFSPNWTRGEKALPRKWFFVCFGLMATLWIWSYGRADWIHMVFCVPILFFLGAHEVDWRAERLRPALVKAWIIIACAAALLRWSVWWIHHPPSLAQVLSLDSMVVRKSAPAILGHLPSIQGRKPPVVFLPHGSTLYFYWAPVPPPLDLLFPPSDKYNAPWEYSRMAEFIQKNGIPYVLIEPGFAKPFIDEPTDLARLLKRDFRQAGSSRLGTLFERKSNGHPPP